MKKRFPEGWAPPRKISRSAMDALRQLHQIDPEGMTTAVLAEKFKISPEAVRRILKSKWTPSQEKKEKLDMREKEMRARIRAEKEKKEAGALRKSLPLGEKKGKDRLSLRDRTQEGSGEGYRRGERTQNRRPRERAGLDDLEWR